jgi:hypothetical protein
MVFGGLVIAIIAIAGALFVLWPRGVRVTVTIRGPLPLRDMVVLVRGNSYRSGDLGIGVSRTVNVQSHGESSVHLEFTRETGERVQRYVPMYFEGAGYEGTIEVDLEGGAIVRIDDRIGLWPSLPWRR